MPCAAASYRSTRPASFLVAAVAAEPVGGSWSGGGVRTGRHSPDCDCSTCERLTLGEFAYPELAEELGSDDPEVIEPIWRTRCEARIADYARSAAQENFRACAPPASHPPTPCEAPWLSTKSSTPSSSEAPAGTGCELAWLFPTEMAR